MRRLFVVCIFTALSIGALTETARASWVGDHCSKNQASDSNVRRLDAQAYAAVADEEGYEWGGGCWNDNNKDDTPSQPDSGGEGPDCSGLTFKTWELPNTYGVSGFTWYDKLQNIHGPYTTTDFHNPASSAPFYQLPDKDRPTTIYMDAFAKIGHIGILWTGANPSANTDYIMEALGDSKGVGVFEESYRYDSAYTAVRREDWTPDCWPNCHQASPRVVRVP
jgi:hypothetical protein